MLIWFDFCDVLMRLVARGACRCQRVCTAVHMQARIVWHTCWTTATVLVMVLRLYVILAVCRATA
jgi:hypothetical protein